MHAPADAIPERRQRRTLLGAAFAIVLLMNCSESTAPAPSRTGVIAIAPRLAVASSQGEVTQVRVVLTRLSDETVARDTTVSLSPADTLVDLAVTVRVRVPGEEFELRLELSDTRGVLVYLGGPVVVTAVTAGAATPVEVLLMPAAGWPIVFAGDSMGGLSTGVFVVNPDGTGLARLVPIPSSVLGRSVLPRWSPDRSRVAYGYEELVGNSVANRLFVTTVDGAATARLVSDTNAAGARWSSDGTHLAFVCYGYDLQYVQIVDVCAIDDVTGPVTALAGRGDAPGRVVLTDRVPNPAGRSSGPGAFAWDPANPDRIAFVRDSTGVASGVTSSRLYAATFAGGTWTVTPLSNDVMDAGSGPLQIASARLDWSPDGRRLVFAAYDPTFALHIYTIGSDGSGLTQLTFGAGWNDDPLFSPDGSQILFTRDVNCDLDAWLMNADGSSQRQVTAEGVCDYDTSILGYDWSPDGDRLVLTGFDAYGNQVIYTIPSTTTAASYLAARARIGRGADPGGYLRDIQPSWRP